MQQNKRKKMIYFAWVLIFLSLNILSFGLLLDSSNSKKLINPVNDVEPLTEEENTVSITTVDGSEVVPGNKITNTKDKSKNKDNNSSSDQNKDGSNDKDNTSSGNKNSGEVSGNSNSNGGGVNKPSPSSSPSKSPTPSKIPSPSKSPTPSKPTPSPSPSPSPSPTPTPPSGNGGGNESVHIPTIDETNINLRNSIQNTYGIQIKYGEETSGYKIGGIYTTPVSNSTSINVALNRLKNALSLYPNGFFYEIKNGGIPLSVYFVNNYSDYSITGATDSNYNYAIISIALMHPFEASFYHESYHYIERYLFKRGANFNSWNSFNPSDFRYGTIINSYSYASTFSDMSYFVNNYAQTSDTEDRASTFEYMMADNRASCLNEGRAVWKKAHLIKNTIEAVFNTVNPGVTEYWERFV